MRIYTRTGDDGTTSLFGGGRVGKDHPRLEAYGSLDELNSVLGVLRLHLREGDPSLERLTRVQGDLFNLGALLATPPEQMERLQARLARPLWTAPEMEADIDRLSELAPPMSTFVLPGGSPAAAHAHLARAVCRRVERLIVNLQATAVVPGEVLVYLNRLSDWLFALARAENAKEGGDIPWIPAGAAD